MTLTTFNAVRPATPDLDLTDRERETLSLLVKGFIMGNLRTRIHVCCSTPK